MIKKVLAIILCLGQPSWAALSVVHTDNADNDASGGAISAAAQNHTAGNLLVVLTDVNRAGGATTMSISNTAGDTWLHATGADKQVGNSLLQIFYAVTNGNSSDIVTATPDLNSTFRAISVYEVTDSNGAFSGDPLDDTDNGTGSTASVTTANTIAVTAASDIILAIILYTSGAATAGSGYTLTTTNLGTLFASEYHIVTAAEFATATAGAATWVISGASFKGVAGSALAPQRLLQGVGK